MHQFISEKLQGTKQGVSAPRSNPVVIWKSNSSRKKVLIRSIALPKGHSPVSFIPARGTGQKVFQFCATDRRTRHFPQPSVQSGLMCSQSQMTRRINNGSHPIPTNWFILRLARVAPFLKTQTQWSLIWIQSLWYRKLSHFQDRSRVDQDQTRLSNQH